MQVCFLSCFFLLNFCFMDNPFCKGNNDNHIRNSYSKSFYFDYGMIVMKHNFRFGIGVFHNSKTKLLKYLF